MSETSRKKRVLLLGDGRQVHTNRWGAYLIDIGYDVLTVSLEPITAVAGPTQRIRVSKSLPDFIRYPIAIPEVKSIIGEFDPDVVNAHFLPNYGMIASLAVKRPWVLSTWGSDIMLLPEKSAFHRWRTRFVIKRAAFITSDADVMTERLVELGADADRVLTFPFGIDRNLFKPGTAKHGAAPRIISNRKLELVYDVGSVVDAFMVVRDKIPHSTLTVAGNGTLMAALRRRVTKEARDDVSFVGDVSHGDMPDVLRSHDIFVSMARSDTTSVSLLEAMACGLYPIVSDIPANREWIEHGVNGWLVPRGDSAGLASAVTSVWNDRQHVATAREANLKLVAKRADWSDNMAAVRDLFERLSSGDSSIRA